MSGISKILFRLPPFLRRKHPPIPSGDRARPLDLTGDQVEGLRRLVEHPQWAHLQTVYSRLWEREAEVLCKPGLTYEQWLRQQALVQSIRELATVAETILQHETMSNERDRRIAESDARHADPLYAIRNSGWYRPTDPAGLARG